MNISEQITKRFTELDAQSKRIRVKDGWVDQADAHQWGTSVFGLLASVFAENAPHLSNFRTAYDTFRESGHYPGDLDPMKGIFQSAKADYAAGYIFQVQALVSGEIFGNFVVLAKTALEGDNKDVAAVLACAALEDCLKRFALLNGLAVDGKDMTEVVNALKSKGLVKGAQKTLLDSMPKIRNLAMHGEWVKISAPEVSSVIGFVERFLLDHFS